MRPAPDLHLGDQPYILPRGDLRPGRNEILAVDILLRHGGERRKYRLSVDELSAWIQRQPAQLQSRLRAIHDNLLAPPSLFGGLDLSQPVVMGIVNVTPDSFSDGGETLGTAPALARGREMLQSGARLLDVGGESTRPGAAPVAPDQEISRIVPVIEGLRTEGVAISVDTRNAPVMEAAAKAGASIINDITALTGDPEALATAAALDLPVMLMHMRGEPGTMQQAPSYEDVLLDVYDYLEARIGACEAAGIPRHRIAIDPGIGFGKDDSHNISLISGLALLRGLGCAIVLGVSRKSVIGRLAGIDDPKRRLPGSLALALAGLQHGASIIRVHDVSETVQGLSLWQVLDEI